MASSRNAADMFIHASLVAKADGGELENADIYFELASLSKTLYAYCALSLYKEGLLDIDKPLFEYAPGVFLSTDANAKRITAKDVLRHSTGLKNWDACADKKFSFDVGQAFQYSGEGYFYLQKCIESAFSLSFQRLLDKYVNNPLGLRIASRFMNIPNSCFVAYPNLCDGEYEPIDRANAAYSAYGTARDYAAFLRCFLLGDMAKTALSADVRVNDRIRWCLGCGLYGERYAFQYGDNGDFQGFYYVDLEEKRVWLRLENDRRGLMNAVNEISPDDFRQGVRDFLAVQYAD